MTFGWVWHFVRRVKIRARVKLKERASCDTDFFFLMDLTLGLGSEV